MKVINMREAKSKLSSLIKSKETIIVTMRNKPVARIEALSPIEASLLQAQEALRNTGISDEMPGDFRKFAKIYASTD